MACGFASRARTGAATGDVDRVSRVDPKEVCGGVQSGIQHRWRQAQVTQASPEHDDRHPLGSQQVRRGDASVRSCVGSRRDAYRWSQARDACDNSSRCECGGEVAGSEVGCTVKIQGASCSVGGVVGTW